MPHHNQRNLRSHHKGQIRRFFKPKPEKSTQNRKPKTHAAPAQLPLIQQDGNNLLLLQALIKQAKKHPFLSVIILLMLSSTIIALLRNRQDTTTVTSCLGNVTDTHTILRSMGQQQTHLHPLMSHSFPISEPPILYKTLPVFNVSSTINNCTDKTIGVSGGKICHIGRARYYLKTLESNKGEKDTFLLSMYNTALLKDNMRITVPKMLLVYEKNGLYKTRSDETKTEKLYLASEEVAHFTSINSLHKTVRQKFQLQQKSSSSSTLTYKTMLRQELVKHIGEQGIAQLAIAGSFLGDVVGNLDNWGYNDKGLVVIDVDHSPDSFMEYFTQAADSVRDIGVDLSLQTIKLMRDSYQKMQHKSVPTFHKEVDMPSSFYDLILKFYIRVCNEVIQEIESNHPDLNEQQPHNTVNEILKKSYIAVMINIHIEEDLTGLKRYAQEDIESRHPIFP